MQCVTNHGWLILQSGITAIAGLGGVYVGGWLTARNQAIERKHNRIREQLESFYSPLIGMHSEIQAKNGVRKKLHDTANSEWAKLFDGIHNPDTKQRINETHWPQYERLIDHSEIQVRDELVPVYRKMLEYFSAHMWLAEKSTRSFYATFTEFVELYNRQMSASLPYEVNLALGHSEDSLQAFYADLQKNFDWLSDELKK
jgi:hypothetical protein